MVLLGGGYTAYRAFSGDPLAGRDPHGAEACDGLRQWLAGDLLDKAGKPEKSLIVAGAVADQAYRSTTESIRAAAGNDVMDAPEMQILKDYGGPASLRFADLKKVHRACVDEGEDMPAYSPPN